VWRSGRLFARNLGRGLLGLALALAGCTSSAREEDQILETIAAARSPATSATLPETGTAAVQALGSMKSEVVVPPTPLRGANGLACANGRLFVTAAAGNTVAEVKADGSVLPLQVPEELSAPDDLAFAADGSLLVTAMRSGSVWRRAASGTWDAIASSLPGANGIAVGADGRLFVSQCFFSDAVVELPTSARIAPRTIAKDLGCPNGFFVEPSGSLVVPLLEKGKVVRLDPKSGATVELASGIAKPTAAKQDHSGGILVLESGSGAIRRIAPGTSRAVAPEKIAQLAPGLDNFTFCGESLLVSSFITGSIQVFKPWPGEPRTLVPGGLVTPRGLLLRSGELLVADGVSLKRIHKDKAPEVLFAVLIDPLPSPVGLAGGAGDVLYVSSPESGSIHRLDLASHRIELVADALEWPTSIALTPAGDLLVAETGAGKVLRIGPTGQQEDLASGLLSPIGLALSRERVLTAEPAGGRILAIGTDGAPTVVASDLRWPSGLAVDERGQLFVAEVDAGRVLRIGSDGSTEAIASGLTLDAGEHSLPLPVGLATDAEGGLLVASPANGSVLRFAER
jgi:sugar lactone lactonase YvrE